MTWDLSEWKTVAEDTQKHDAGHDMKAPESVQPFAFKTVKNNNMQFHTWQFSKCISNPPTDFYTSNPRIDF